MEQEKQKSFFQISQLLSVYWVIFIVFLLLKLYLDISHGYSKESWQITEWLINYQGGFVRRGLLGEILFRLYEWFNIEPYGLIIFFSLLSYFTLAFLFFKLFIKKAYPIFILPFVFFLGGAILNDYLVKKDSIILLLFIFILYVYVRKSRFYLIYIHILLCTGLLIHEIIGFFTIPVLFLLFVDRYKDRLHSKTERFFRSFMTLFPSILVFLLVSYYKGDLEVANLVWASWRNIPFPYNEFMLDPPAAIEGLSWTALTGIKNVYYFISAVKFRIIYIPFLWISIFVLVYIILSNINKFTYKILTRIPVYKNNREVISVVLIFQLFSLLPILLIATDYGRWVSFWTIPSFAIILLVPEVVLRKIYPQCLFSFATRINQKINYLNLNSTFKLYLLCILIFIGGTLYYVTESFNSSSIFFILRTMMSFIL